VRARVRRLILGPVHERLLGRLPERDAGRRPPRLEPGAQVRGHLLEVLRHLLEARDVVRVLLPRRERELRRELHEVALRPAELRDRRLLRVERRVRDALAQLLLEERRVGPHRGRERGAVDLQERKEPHLRVLDPVAHRLGALVVELGVVPAVPALRRPRRVAPHRLLEVFVEEREHLPVRVVAGARGRSQEEEADEGRGGREEGPHGRDYTRPAAATWTPRPRA
jgi:hypothetical protein